MVEVVNMVGSGDLETEVDLEALSSDLQRLKIEYNPQSIPAVRIRLDDDSPVWMLFRTGKYTIMGASTEEELYDTANKIYEILSDFIDINQIVDPEIVNISCRASLQEGVDFEKLMDHFGTENVQYEPEQNPFLVYRPDEPECAITVAANGELAIAGITSREAAIEVFEEFRKEVDNIQ